MSHVSASNQTGSAAARCDEPGETAAIVEIAGLQVRRHDQVICRLERESVSLGERLSIVGPNGSGKTTLLRVLSGFEKGYAGDCRVRCDSRDLVYVHQSPMLFRGSVLKNVTYGLASRWVARRERQRLATEWLDRFGIADLRSRNVRLLSGGEQRRVVLARACVLQPKLLLLDEPFADLDEPGIDQVCQALREMTETTILIASPTSPPEGVCTRSVTLSGVK